MWPRLCKFAENAHVAMSGATTLVLMIISFLLFNLSKIFRSSMQLPSLIQADFDIWAPLWKDDENLLIFLFTRQ